MPIFPSWATSYRKAFSYWGQNLTMLRSGGKRPQINM